MIEYGKLFNGNDYGYVRSNCSSGSFGLVLVEKSGRHWSVFTLS